MARATEGGTEFDPAVLDRVERRFWAGIWDAVPAAVAAEHGVVRTEFGPVGAYAVGDLPAVRMLNQVLDAGIGDTVAEGSLAAAIDWMRSRGVRAQVSLTPGLPGSERVAAWLEDNGFEPLPGWMKFVRDAHPPRFETAAGVEVVEVDSDGTLPFAAIAAAAFGLPAWAADLFSGLPSHPDWRCYVALVDGEPQGCGTMLLDGEVAELGMGGTLEGGRRRGCQLAVLGRRIEDAAAAGARTLFVETGARVPGRPSSSYRNILRAGFEEAYLSPGWVDARLPAG